MQLERLSQALNGFVRDDSVDEKTLRAHCKGYIFAALDENCSVSFNFDPRFEELTKSRHTQQINRRAVELAKALLAAARFCVGKDKKTQAAAVLRIAFDCLTEAKLEDAKEYQLVKEQLEAVG